jgi:hypothetical protein
VTRHRRAEAPERHDPFLVDAIKEGGQGLAGLGLEHDPVVRAAQPSEVVADDVGDDVGDAPTGAHGRAVPVVVGQRVDELV